MTVAIGLACKDGVLVAADSMGSDEFTSTFSQKVRVFGRTPAIWTASGSQYVMEEVTVEIDKLDAAGTAEAAMKAFTSADKKAIRNCLSVNARRAMQSAYSGALASAPLPPGHIAPALVTDFLFLGFSDGTPWFLEIARDGSLNWHESFYAVGSGGPFATVALGLMKHYISDDLAIEDAKLLAYRTIETTIEVSNSRVGLPVQIAVCDRDGARILGETEIEQIRTGVERWKTLEAESLSSLKSGEILPVEDDLPTLTDARQA